MPRWTVFLLTVVNTIHGIRNVPRTRILAARTLGARRLSLVLTVLVAITRGFAIYRNRRIKHKSDLRSAIGVRHSTIRQKSMGFMGGSFNTREFFHGASNATLRLVKLFFIVTVFVVPVGLLGASNALQSAYLPILAFAVQYVGLMAERWYFFAEAKHPQNLYYQTVG